MAITLKPEARLFSAVCATGTITGKAPAGEVELTIGGLAPVSAADDRDGSGSVAKGHDRGLSIGKRYVDEAESIELLCTEPGDGIPALGGEVPQLEKPRRFRRAIERPNG